MSTIPPLIPANGILNPESPVKNSPNPITSVNNGFIHNSIGSVANPVTNQNGQLGANAMVNLAKMASSQPKPTIQTNVVHNSVLFKPTLHALTNPAPRLLYHYNAPIIALTCICNHKFNFCLTEAHTTWPSLAGGSSSKQ